MKSKADTSTKNTQTSAKAEQRHTCGALNRRCKQCGRRYPKTEREMTACPQCQTSRLCKSDKLGSNRRCRMHGGKNPTGTASPRFKHGLYSQAWERLELSQYYERVADADLLDSSEAMRSLQARALFVLERGQGGHLYNSIREAWREFKQSGRSKDLEGQRVAAARLETLIEQGGQEADRWKEYYDVEERLDRMRQRSHKRMVEGQLLVKLDLVINIIGIFVFAVKGILKKELEALGSPELTHSISTQIEREFRRIFGQFQTGKVEEGESKREEADFNAEGPVM